MSEDFIFELGCEELPSASVWALAKELKDQVQILIEKAQLNWQDIKIIATPRRIGLIIKNLATEQPEQIISRKGPALSAAYDASKKPTPALIGFAKSCNVEINALKTTATEKGDWIVYENVSKGRLSVDLMPEIMSQALSKLTISKPMRWGSFDYEFARPVHWILMLYGDELLNAEYFGIRTKRTTRGHRFHNPDEVIVSSAQHYQKLILQARVVIDFVERKQIIQSQIETLARSQGAIAIIPDELLHEVTSIVEWPNALMAKFDKKFLEVPSECLIASMQAHQKCFALKDNVGNLLPAFITVSNIESNKPQQVILGNEKVMCARLSDAAFFYEQDKLTALNDRIAATKKVVFQAKLGSLFDKSNRIKSLMSYLSDSLAYSKTSGERAAQLSKCDLLSGMVGEFPELQGLMGYYYALNDKENPAVALALNEQYMPRFAADVLPQSPLGLALSLADRIDTLVGIFAIGLKPSGVKDPFKLRRHALACVRILLSTQEDLDLKALLLEAANSLDATVNNEKLFLNELEDFIWDRAQSYYLSQDYSLDLIYAVKANQHHFLQDFDKRIRSLKTFSNLPEASYLSAACKRVANILAQQKIVIGNAVNLSLFTNEAETQLYQNLVSVEENISSFNAKADYMSTLKLLAKLKNPIDTFFDQVMVLVDDESIKANRLALLIRLQTILQNVADISLLQIK